MPAAIEFIQNHPLYGVALALIIVFVVLSIIKKLVTFALIAVALLIGYGYFLHTRGEEERLPSFKIKQAIEDLQEKAQDAIDKVKK